MTDSSVSEFCDCRAVVLDSGHCSACGARLPVPDEERCTARTPNTPVCRDGLPNHRTVGAATCGYCNALAKLYWTGRRWICAPCFRRHLGEYPEAPDA